MLNYILELELTIFIFDLEVSVVEVYGGHHGVARVDDGAHAGREERQVGVLQVLTSETLQLNKQSQWQ